MFWNFTTSIFLQHIGKYSSQNLDSLLGDKDSNHNIALKLPLSFNLAPNQLIKASCQSAILMLSKTTDIPISFKLSNSLKFNTFIVNNGVK